MPGAYAHSGAQMPDGVCAKRCWASAKPSRSANSRSRGFSSGWKGCDSGPPSSSMVPPSTSSRSSGLPPCRHSVVKSSSARSASATSRRPNSRNGSRRVVASRARSSPVGQPVMHARQAVRVIELCGDHRGHPQRHQVTAILVGQPAQHPHQRQVCRRPRLVEPFLTDRPATVVGQPRQVGVQDEGEEPGDRRGGTVSRPHRDRDQVQAVVDVAVRPRRSGRNRRR